MRFLVDEDVAIEIIRCLRQQGHEVVVVAEVLGFRTPDDQIWKHAARTKSILLTCNRGDFLRLAGTDPTASLIVLNRRRTRQAECNHLLRLLAGAGETGLSGNINFA